MKKTKHCYIILMLPFCIFAFTARSHGSELLNCWDGTFAYSFLKVQDLGSNLTIELSSEDARIFEPLAPELTDFWGEGKLTIVSPKENCSLNTDKSLISCKLQERATGRLDIKTNSGAVNTTPNEIHRDIRVVDSTIEMIAIERVSKFSPTKALLFRFSLPMDRSTVFREFSLGEDGKCSKLN